MNKIVCAMWIGFVGLTLSFYAPVAKAAELYSTAATKQVQVGDTVVVDVRLNTEGKQLNAVEGVVHVQGGVAKVLDISVGGSALTIWPRPPVAQVTAEGVDIWFTGGVPGGFAESDALLFKVVVVPEKSGKIILQPEQVVSYENDGQGTKVLASTSSFTLSVVEGDGTNTNSWEQAVTSDTVSPEPFTITLGQDNSVYDNKKFISFNTTDAGSGVDHYEVAEDASAPIRAESPYVLREQGARRVTVTAYDKAGNAQLATLNLPPEHLASTLIVYVGIALGVLCILIVLVYRAKRQKKTK
ncbi:MAG: hypothetical protein JNK33_05175 [Candidatus Doudnabacteria bacterium]|nr:hypothetical protein [Candidatus Doudnabacteria bacterium]